MDIKEIRGYLDLLSMYPNIEEFDIKEDGGRIMFRQKQYNSDRGTQEMTKKENPQSLVEVKAPVVGMFHYLVLGKNIKTINDEELKKIIANGNNRIEINRGFYVAQGQVLGTIIQLNIPFPVEATCAGIIEKVFLVAEQGNCQQSYPVGYGEVLFIINKEFSLK